MDFKLATPFLEAFEELDKLNEATDINASKKFWSAAKVGKMEEDAFHAAFDDELIELGLMDMFDADGVLVDNYGRIFKAKEANPDSWAVKALGKLWALRYKNQQLFKSEATKAAAEAQRRAEQRLQDEEAAKVAKQAKLNEYQEILKTYISKVDPAIVAAYEEATGVSASSGITLTADGEEPAKSWRDKPTPKYGLHFIGWDCYYSIAEPKFVESRVINMLAAGMTKATTFIHSAEFKKIDVFSADKRATVILLGASGTLYELTGTNDGEVVVSVNGEGPSTPEVITEPYKIIFTRTSWSDGNHHTTSDSASATYLSWNSTYTDKLTGLVPTKFGRTDSYLGGYTETKKVTTPDSKNYSYEEGIDSWAEIYTLTGATD